MSAVAANIAIQGQSLLFVSIDAPDRYAVRNNWGRVVGPVLTRTQLLAYVRDLAAMPGVEVHRWWGSRRAPSQETE